MPALRKIAKQLKSDDDFATNGKELFLSKLPHKYYEENVLHAIMLSEEKDFDVAIEKSKRFCHISTTGPYAMFFRRSALKTTKTGCGNISKSGSIATKPIRCVLQ